MKMALFFLPLYFLTQPALGSDCGDGEHWVRPHHHRAYYKADGTFYRAGSVIGHCQGSSSNYSFWESKLKDGRPTPWSNKKEVTKSWTMEERERTLEALGDLPESLWDKDPIYIYRMAASQTTKGNPGSSLDRTIVLYDSAFDENQNLAEILSHELAHQNHLHLSREDKRAYAEETGWNNPKDIGGSDIWIPTRPRKNYVESDGLDSPWEEVILQAQQRGVTFFFATSRRSWP